ncbi:hypothetical protein BTJ44_00314 [Bacillus mycoides]|nr:hypothetical protein BTJ44_00314 [Bacillus mycoides]OSY12096.1 hypothetical protein BTJ48_01310 [Bacillus mycoides]
MAYFLCLVLSLLVFVICIIVREIIIEEKHMKSAWHRV